MVVQNNHLQKALNDLSAAHQRVAGEDYAVEDLEISLAILERSLADALQTKPELLDFLQHEDLTELPSELKAHSGRVFAVRAVLLFELGHPDHAALSARYSIQCLQETLEFSFDDEDRYVAVYLHKLLTKDVIPHAISGEEIAGLYELLFDFYRQEELFDRAEDVLFHALSLTTKPEPLLKKGIGFYEGLQRMETRYLQKRGLPRYEVNEAHRELLEQLARLES